MSIVMRRLKRIVLTLLILFISLFIFCNLWIVRSTEGRIFSDLSKLPHHRIALVLGTSHRTTSGGPNPFFEKRIETAAELYKMGKIDHLILSGDNRSRYYNEPMAMLKALLKKGVPASAITLDYAGLRTLDSIVRCKEIFGQDKFIIITQPFHSYRAVFISQYYDINAIAMVAEEPDFEYSMKVRVREYLARTKAVLDLYVLKTPPRFLGRKEEINVQEAQ
jgi:SanA protein